MSSSEYQTPWFCEKIWDSTWGNYENPSMYFTDQVERSTEPSDVYNGSSFNFEPKCGSDASLLRFALDSSSNLSPECAINYLTFSDDAPSEYAKPTPMNIEFWPTADQRQPLVQPFQTDSGPIVHTTQFPSATSADLQNGFVPVAESAAIEFTYYQQQDKPPPASDQNPWREQSTPAGPAALPSLEAQNPMVPTSSQPPSCSTRAEDRQEPRLACCVKGCGKEFGTHEYLRTHSESHSIDGPFACTWPSCSQKIRLNKVRNKHMKINTDEKKFACYVCKKLFRRNGDLKNHMLTHTQEKKFACEVCKKEFGRKNYLKSHMLTHTQEKKIECEICDKKYARNAQLKSHMLTHTQEKKFACEVCNKAFVQNCNLKRHMLIHTQEKQFACEVCKKEFGRKDYLKRHMLTHTQEKKIECEICDKKFARNSQLKSHMLTHTQEKKIACDVFADLRPPSEQTLSTSPRSLIEVQFTNAECLELENRYFGGLPVRCDTPPFHSATSADLQISFLPVARSALIEIGNQQVKPPPAFDRNPWHEQPIPEALPSLEIQTPVMPNSSQPPSCSRRTQDSAAVPSLAIHIPMVLGSRSNDDEKSSGSFACSVVGCGKEFSKLDYLQKHLKRHSNGKLYLSSSGGENHVPITIGEKKFTCRICEITFASIGYLRRHIGGHAKEENYTCDVCNEEFACYDDIKTHMTSHPDDERFTCKICGKNFALVRYLRRHMKAHYEKKTFECEVCCKRFSCETHLEQHMVVHTKEKKFECNICNMRFGQEATLNRHAAVHTGKDKFLCGVCNKEISRYDNFKVHMKIHEKSER